VTDDGCLAVVNVGDSRAYLMHHGELRQLTTDHSVTAELVARGDLSEHEAQDHPMHGYLTRALGVGPTVEADSAIHPRLLAIDYFSVRMASSTRFPIRRLPRTWQTRRASRPLPMVS
jgi:serine/threonine protein phosphatase PrpC